MDVLKTYLLNLGCPKNQVDGEYFAGYLKGSDRVELISDYQKAELIIVNTCGFIDSAKEESLEAILEAASLKEQDPGKKLVVTGCLAQRYHQELEEEIPEIDGIFGIGEHQQLLELVEKVARGKKDKKISRPEHKLNREMPRINTDGHYAYLKIADGCDKVCTYCTIPEIKGGYSSRRIEYILQEAEALVAGDVRELILVAQDTSLYGRDIYGEKKLTELLENLIEIDGLDWIRIMYYYPEEIEKEFLELMAREEKICSYLDIPIQHAAREVRRRMARQGDAEDLKEKISLMRKIVPDIALRTTMLVGFPGETEEDFAELLDFVREIKFDKLGVFTYSREEGTPAAAMAEQLPDEVKNERYNRLMELQRKISLSNNQKFTGEVLAVLLDEILDEEFIGRTRYDAPEIDNSVTGKLPEDRSKKLSPGEIVSCRITGAYEYDLTGEIVDEYA